MSSLFSGKLLLIVGPSGVGKGTTIALLKKRHPTWVFPLSATTRPKRPQETEGETYHFFSHDQFLQKREAGDFIEWACVHENNFYGTLKSEIIPFLKEGKTVLREVDIQGFESIRKIVPSEDLLSFFLLPPESKVLSQRIRARAPISKDELQKRLKSISKEVSLGKDCDIHIQSKEGVLEYAANEVEKALKDSNNQSL